MAERSVTRLHYESETNESPIQVAASENVVHTW
jgi:hypothetical protein